MAGGHLFEHYAVECRSGRFGLEAPDLSAATDTLVVEDGEMSDFAREAGAAVAELSVYDHSQTQAPADVEDEECLFGALACHILRVCDSSGVVLNVDRHAQFFLQYVGDRFVFADEIGETVSGMAVDAAREDETVAADSGKILSGRLEAFPDCVTHAAAGFFGVREGETEIVLKETQLSHKVGHGNAQTVPFNIHSHEVSRLGIQTIYYRFAPAGGFHLADFLDEAGVDEVSDYSGCRRHGSVVFAAEVSQCELLVIDAVLQNQVLEERIFAVEVVQEGLFLVCSSHRRSVLLSKIGSLVVF